MNTWLYQMNNKEGWTPGDYRLTVWEGETVDWPTGRITSPSKEQPQPGDVVMFFFTRSSTPSPGIYGWALVTEVHPKSQRFHFRALPHSDMLKIDPIYDEVIEQLVERVRGKFKQGTMWSIVRADFIILKDQIQKHES